MDHQLVISFVRYASSMEVMREGSNKDVEMSMGRHHIGSREDPRNFMDVVQNIVVLQDTTTDGRLSKQTTQT